jgi:transposase InsO family protein
MIQFQGKNCSALLDTGSVVTTISESYLKENHPDLNIQPLVDIVSPEFNLEAATGSRMPIAGYVIAILYNYSLHEEVQCIVLVVNETAFTSQVPLIIGTNVLAHLQTRMNRNSGTAYTLAPEWRESLELLNSTVDVGSAQVMEDIIVPPNSTVTCSALARTKICEYKHQVSTELCQSAKLHPSLEIVSTLHDIKPGSSKQPIAIRIRNKSGSELVIPGHTMIARLHLVTSTSVQSFATQDISDQEYLKMFDLSETNLSLEQRMEAERLLLANKDVFSLSEFDIGCSQLGQHDILMDDDTPIKQRFRRIPPSIFEEVRQHLQNMVNTGVIRPSVSPWASPIVLVRKKDGSLRFCIDYRAVNSRTKKDAYALPRVEEALDSMSGCKWFGSLDLRSGYWQTRVNPAHRERTAFTAGPLGLWEFDRMPFGMVNAAATFQRTMELTLHDILYRECLVYIDDIIVYSKSFSQHISRLQSVFTRLKENNLKLKPSKCKLFASEITFLGHVIGPDGIKTDPSKIDKVKDWKVPTCIKELRQFLGFASYFRKFIRDFAIHAKPLNELLQGHGHVKGKKSGNLSSWHWSQEQQKSFEYLKECLSSTPVLAFADFSLPFELEVDASVYGLGAILFQVQDGHRRIIACASRSTSMTEQRYSTYKREFLALKWAVTEKFKEYLYGSSFKVFTDNNPLSYVLSTGQLDAVGHRWLSNLSSFSFEIFYKAGKYNAAADALSRLDEPRNIGSILPYVAPAGTINMIQPGPCLTPQAERESKAGEQFTPLPVCHLIPLQELETVPVSDEGWRNAQISNPYLKLIYEAVANQQRLDRRSISSLPQSLKYLHWQYTKLYVHNGVLCRSFTNKEGKHQQVVVPPSLQKTVTNLYHIQLGHLGETRTVNALRERFFWPQMNKTVHEQISHCLPCISFKVKPTTNIKATMDHIGSNSYPMEAVSIDYLSIDPKSNKSHSVLVAIDHFTKFAWALPTRNQTANTTAKALFNSIFMPYGFPARIHSDRGANFESQVISELCRLARIHKTRTTPWHPMGNGLCERLNQTILSMLGTLPDKFKSQWNKYLPSLMYAYNSTVQDSTGYTPFYLMFGRTSRLPVDVQLGVNQGAACYHTKYPEELKEQLSLAFEQVRKNLAQSGDKQKQRYDTKVRQHKLQVGDLVLVRNVGPSAQHKLAPRWEKEVYVVMKQCGDSSPVYQVKPEHCDKPLRTLHRNMLLPFAYLINQETSDDVDLQSTETHKSIPIHKPDMSESESEDDEEPQMVLRSHRATPVAQSVDINVEVVPPVQVDIPASPVHLDVGTLDDSSTIEVSVSSSPTEIVSDIPCTPPQAHLPLPPSKTPEQLLEFEEKLKGKLQQQCKKPRELSPQTEVELIDPLSMSAPDQPASLIEDEPVITDDHLSQEDEPVAQIPQDPMEELMQSMGDMSIRSPPHVVPLPPETAEEFEDAGIIDTSRQPRNLSATREATRARSRSPYPQRERRPPDRYQCQSLQLNQGFGPVPVLYQTIPTMQAVLQGFSNVLGMINTEGNNQNTILSTGIT